MPTRHAVLALLSVALAAAPVASGQSEPDMSWYVASLCPDDGIACTTEDVVYGQCRHLTAPGACPADGARVVDPGTAPRASRRSPAPPMPHALRFDGVDDVVTTGASPALPITKAFTIEAWVRPSEDPRPGSRGVIAGVDGGFLLARSRDGSLEWALHVAEHPFGFVEVRAANAPRSVWSHVALTWDGARVRTYLNGALVSTQAAPGAIRQAAAAVARFRIGGGDDAGRGADFFAGSINDVRLWRIARTGAAIASDRGRRLRGTEAGLIGYWRLDEGRGSVTADAAGGNTGILANGTTWVDGRASRVSTWI